MLETLTKRKSKAKKSVVVPVRVDPAYQLTLEQAQQGDPPYISRLIPRTRMIVDLYFKHLGKPDVLTAILARKLQVTKQRARGIEQRYLMQIVRMIKEDNG